jgi:aminoglycoside 6-adenylyltransferase
VRGFAVDRRTDDDVLATILATARGDARVRAVVLSGSRADPAVPADDLRDFDVVYVVTDVPALRDERGWLEVFGEPAIVQTPDAMEGAPAREDGGFVFLMQFTDGHRIDLTLLPVAAMTGFRHDGPAVVLHDPDGLVPAPPPPDAPYHVPAPPTAQPFADACNEFWWVAPYVAKGLLRGELTYARHHLDTVMRAQLMTVIDWQVAGAHRFTRGAGKFGRHLRRELDAGRWALLEATYASADADATWDALEAMARLFRSVAAEVAARHGLAYPEDDDRRVMALLRRMRARAGSVQRAHGAIDVDPEPPPAAWPAARELPGGPTTVLDELPDLLAWPDGRRVETAADWPVRARTWRDLLVDVGYGGLPPAPDVVALETRSEARVHRLPGAPRLLALTVRARLRGGEAAFAVRLLLPDAPAPVPAVAYGDGCWWQLDDATLARFAARGVALAVFDRTEVAPDGGRAEPGGPPPERRGGLFDLVPGATFGALSAWAWAYQRAVDLLRDRPEIDPERIAVTGFSRGGKAALLAGATDERVALVHAHASGAGGAAPYRVLGEGAETLDVARAFPTWFGPRLRDHLGRERELPFDQHALLAAVAPRALLLTCGVDDRWANPAGTVAAARAAGEAFRLLGAPDALRVALREGGHGHTPADWQLLLDTIAWRWQGGPEPEASG